MTVKETRNLYLKKALIRFLKENNCYKQFTRNYYDKNMSYYFWKKHVDEKNKTSFLKIQFSNEVFTNFIDSHFNIIETFDYNKTKEGFAFWKQTKI